MHGFWGCEWGVSAAAAREAAPIAAAGSTARAEEPTEVLPAAAVGNRGKDMRRIAETRSGITWGLSREVLWCRSGVAKAGWRVPKEVREVCEWGRGVRPGWQVKISNPRGGRVGFLR